MGAAARLWAGALVEEGRTRKTSTRGSFKPFDPLAGGHR
jgi:hypothetical protein